MWEVEEPSLWLFQSLFQCCLKPSISHFFGHYRPTFYLLSRQPLGVIYRILWGQKLGPVKPSSLIKMSRCHRRQGKLCETHLSTLCTLSSAKSSPNGLFHRNTGGNLVIHSELRVLVGQKLDFKVVLTSLRTHAVWQTASDCIRLDLIAKQNSGISAS